MKKRIINEWMNDFKWIKMNDCYNKWAKNSESLVVIRIISDFGVLPHSLIS